MLLPKSAICILSSVLACQNVAFAMPSQPASTIPSDLISEIQIDVENALKDIKPQKSKNQVNTAILPGERFVIWGEIFRDGHIWAIAEAKSKTAYLEWIGNRWKFREAWDLTPCWLPEGALREDRGFFHITPTKQPFSIKPVGPDKSIALLIAFNNDGYRLGYEIAVPTRDKRNIKLVASSGDGEPDTAAGYLITHESSGRKSWWKQNIYHKWINDYPIQYLTWTNGNVNESDMGPTRFTIDTTPASPVGEKHYRVVQPEGSETTTVLMNEVEFAKIEFTWKHEKFLLSEPSGGAAAEELYFFEKLTGLPGKACGERINGVSIETAKRYQSKLEIKLSGTKEAFQTLSPDRRLYSGQK